MATGYVSGETMLRPTRLPQSMLGPCWPPRLPIRAAGVRSSPPGHQPWFQRGTCRTRVPSWPIRWPAWKCTSARSRWEWILFALAARHCQAPAILRSLVFTLVEVDSKFRMKVCRTILRQPSFLI